MAKGSQFERDFARKLSLWWTGDERDDIFWRSTTSGARATTRAKVGKKTSGSYGDITAIDPVGLPFLKAFTPELKRGYNRETVQDLIDWDRGAWREWIVKARKSAEQAGSKWWMLVVKRDRREPLMVVPANAPTPFHPCLRIEMATYVYRLEQLWESDPKWVTDALKPGEEE